MKERFRFLRGLALVGVGFAMGGAFPSSLAHADDLETEVRSLFEVPRFSPNKEGVEVKDHPFQKQAIALLYLEALREQYAVMGLEVEGKVEERQENIPLHHASHYFDPFTRVSFSTRSWVNLLTFLIPSTDQERQLLQKKLETFQNLERLRERFITSLLERLRAGKAKEMDQWMGEEDFQKQLRQIVESVPGNATEARMRYLEKKYTSVQEDSELREVLQDLRFEIDLADRLIGTGPALPPLGRVDWQMDRVRMLQTLGKTRFVEDTLVFWNKLVPFSKWQAYELGFHFIDDKTRWEIEREGITFSPGESQEEIRRRFAEHRKKLQPRKLEDWETAELRFYWTPLTQFREEVLEEQLPWVLFDGARAYLQAGQKEKFQKALLLGNWLLTECRMLLSYRSIHRIETILKVLNQIARHQGISPPEREDGEERPDSFETYSLEELLQGDLEVSLRGEYDSFDLELEDLDQIVLLDQRKLFGPEAVELDTDEGSVRLERTSSGVHTHRKEGIWGGGVIRVITGGALPQDTGEYTFTQDGIRMGIPVIRMMNGHPAITAVHLVTQKKSRPQFGRVHETSSENSRLEYWMTWDGY